MTDAPPARPAAHEPLTGLAAVAGAAHIKRMIRALIAGAVLIAAAAWSGPAPADQTDPRLDELFARLQAADSQREARPIVQRIWRIWHMHDEEEVLAVMSRGQFYLRQDRLKLALAAFSQAIELDPQFAEAWNARATVHYMLGNYRESLADIERVLALEPRHFGALSGRGLCWEALDKPRKALKAFEASLEVHPRQPGTRARVRELRDELGLRDI